LGIQLHTSLSFSQLPELLQKIFPEQYNYKISEFNLLPLYEFPGAPEFLIEIICWINIKQQDEIEQWKSLFEEKSKTTYRVRLSRATKGKKVIYRKDFYCQHADIANIRKQTRVKQQNENNSRNRNTECLATLLIKIQTKDLASSHPCTVWLNFILITIIQSIPFILYPSINFKFNKIII
jgi:hypothetical protein